MTRFRLITVTVALLLGNTAAALGGLNQWTSGTGMEGGYIQALAIDPVSPATVYAGTNGGGIFKSTDGGGSWDAVNSGLGSLYIHALAINPANRAILYAGTNGGGVFRRTASRTGTSFPWQSTR